MQKEENLDHKIESFEKKEEKIAQKEQHLNATQEKLYDMGQEAGRLVLQKLKKPKMQIQSFITTPELIVRGTT